MAFYGILWHTPYDIRCHKVWQYGYQKKRIDQTKWSKLCRIVWQEQNMKQNPKKEKSNISFVFLGKMLCKFKCEMLMPKLAQISTKFFV